MSQAAVPQRAGPACASTLDRTKRILAIVAVVYAVAVAIALAALQAYFPGQWAAIPDWVAVPVQLIALGVSVAIAVGRWKASRNTALIWALVGAFAAMSLVATCVWNELRPRGAGPRLTYADGLYFIDYGLLTAAYAVTYVRFGGSFRSLRTWLDAVTIIVALLGTFWATLLGPFMPPGQGPRLGMAFAFGYAASLAVLMTMAALVYLRLPSSVRRPIPVLLIAAGLADVVWEIGWVATWLTDVDFVGFYYNYGDVLCFTLIACAAAITPQRPGPLPEPATAERSAYNFLPTLAALLAMALVATSLASTRAMDAWLLVGLVVLTALLLVTRQSAVRREMETLNRQLAMRTADARLMELVRQASDAFLVVDESRVVRFASPAIQAILGISPDHLPGTPATLLAGPSHEPALAGFLALLASGSVPPAPLEIPLAMHDSTLHTLRLSGANKLDNPLIRGLTLTITDITVQRSLERDVLQVANAERIRLASDIHEGLGQQLTGIMMLLQSIAMTPDPDPAKQRENLRVLVGHMREAIANARDLARGLSPMYVVRGSLRGALQRLGKDSSAGIAVHVDVDTRFDDHVIGDFPADHLYRISQEAVLNATRHSDCKRVDVALQVHDDDLVLTITDDGRGYEQVANASGGIGLRLMEYRARVIGAAFAIRRRAAGGTLVKVSVPLRNVARGGDSA